jgi:hypothetical protein
LDAADTDDSKRAKSRIHRRPQCHSRSLDSILQYSRFASRVSDSVTFLGAGCRHYRRRRPRCRVLVALTSFPQVQRCTGRPYLKATTVAACVRKTCHQPHVTAKLLQPPFQQSPVQSLAAPCCVASRFELLYCDYYRRDLGVDLSQHPLTRPAAAALAHCRRAALGTAPSCSITSSPMAWNAYETNVLTNPSLYRQKGDALVQHGCLATLSPLCVPITRNRLDTSMNASVTTGKSYYVFPIHIA